MEEATFVYHSEELMALTHASLEWIREWEIGRDRGADVGREANSA